MVKRTLLFLQRSADNRCNKESNHIVNENFLDDRSTIRRHTLRFSTRSKVEGTVRDRLMITSMLDLHAVVLKLTWPAIRMSRGSGSNRSIYTACARPHQQNLPAASAAADLRGRQTDQQTDGRILDRFMTITADRVTNLCRVSSVGSPRDAARICC